jgi:exodeoxyribonuclease VII small subunit
MATPAKETYQTLRLQLDEVIARLQNPDCDVDEAVKLYEKAVALTAKLEAYLEKAENKVRKVQGIDL